MCGICNGNSSLPCNECGNGYTLYNNIPNSTIVLDGSECFNDIDLSALSDIITANALSPNGSKIDDTVLSSGIPEKLIKLVS